MGNRRFIWLVPGLVGLLLVVIAGFLMTRKVPELSPSASSSPVVSASAEPGGASAKPADAGLPDAADRPTLVALAETAHGISTDTAFRLTLPKTVALSRVEKALHVTPSFGFHLSEQGAEVLLTPDVPLSPGQVYRFDLEAPEANLSESFAFQTRQDFRLMDTLPAHQGTGVPVNTGIEFRFSHSGFAGVAERFTLCPVHAGETGAPVTGRWEMRGDTAAFVPSTTLAPGTLYQGRLQAGVTLPDTQETMEADILFQFQTAPDTRTDTQRRMSLSDILYGFTTRETPELPVYCDETTAGAAWEVSVWRYPDMTAFRQALSAECAAPWWAERDAERVPETNGLSLQTTLHTRLLAANGENRLPLPAGLPEGAYVVACRVGSLADYAFVQVQDMTVYLRVAERNALAWVHDGVTREALAGVVLKTDAGLRVTTDATGTALLEGTIYTADGKPQPLRENLDDGTGLPSEETPVFLTAVRSGRPDLLIPLVAPHAGYRYGYRYASGWWGGDDEHEMALRSWHYLFMDRAFYQPTDTVSFWGVVRQKGTEISPDKVTVTLLRNDGWSNEEGWELQTQTLTVTADGVYTGRFSLAEAESGNYRISVQAEETELDRRYFSVSRYDKPVLTLQAEVSPAVCLPGEEVSVHLSGRFFEGTPVPGLALDAQLSGSGRDLLTQTIRLDTGGEAILSATVPEVSGETSWRPQSGWFTAKTTEPEEAEHAQYGSFATYPRNVMAWMTSGMDKDHLSLVVHAHALDLEEAVRTDPWQYAEDPADLPYLGHTMDLPVQVSLHEHYWDPRVVGKQYDPVSKTTRDQIEYVEMDRKIQSFTATTHDGVWSLETDIPDWREGRSYRLELRCTDTSGRDVLETAYPGGYGYGYGDGNDAFYELVSRKGDVGYRAGETVQFDLRKNGVIQTAPEPGTEVLYLLTREGHVSWLTSEQPVFRFPFESAWIPNAMVEAVVRTLDGMSETYAVPVLYDRTEMGLQVRVETDATEVSPGGQVGVTVSVRDMLGNPVEAEVNLAVVDEAYFAVFPQEVDPLGALYAPVYGSGVLYTCLTNTREALGRWGTGGAEGAEGDDAGEPIRSDFRDTAWFGTLRTDAMGRAKEMVDLPDNLTSFRITAQAVTSSLQAGHAVAHVAVKRPFFVQPVVPDRLLEGDAPTLLLRAYGDGMTRASTAYEISLVIGDGEHRTWSVSGQGQAYVSVPLGPLPVGDAVLSIHAANGDLSDAVEKTLRVEKHWLTAMQTFSFPAEVGGGVPPEVSEALMDNSTATLMLIHRQASLAWETLWQLSGSAGLRVDQTLGRQLAAEMLAELAVDPSLPPVPEEVYDPWQQADGGVALLPYGASDALLSAKVCSIAADRFDRTELRRYFRDIASDATALPERAAAAQWGLASLGEPVLLEVRAQLREEVWTPGERLVLGLALADLGDMAGARQVLDDVRKQVGRSAAPQAWLEVPGGREAVIRATALAAWLAQKTDAQDAESFFRYVSDNKTRVVPMPLEQAAWVREAVRRHPSEARVSLTAAGETHAFELSAGHAERLLLTVPQLRELVFAEVEGDVDAMVVSRTATGTGLTGTETGGVTDAGGQTVSVKRVYQVEGKPVTRLQTTDAVEVVLTVTFSPAAPKGGYSLSDLLPAGLRFTGGAYDTGDNWCWWQPDGQEIRTALHHKGGAATRVFRYRARVSGAGTFAADAPVVRHDESEAGGAGVTSGLIVEAP